MTDLNLFYQQVSTSSYTRARVKAGVKVFLNYLDSRELKLDDAKYLSQEDFRLFYNTTEPARRQDVRLALISLPEWLKENWYLPMVFYPERKKNNKRAKTPILSREEIETMNRASLCTSLRNRAVFLTLRDTGVRTDELLNMQIKDYQGSKIVVCNTMGERELLLSPEAQQAMQEYIVTLKEHGPEAPLWAGRQGEAITGLWLGKIINHISEDLERTVNISDFRHTLVNQMVEQKVPMEEIARIFGFTSEKALFSNMRLCGTNIG
ncbi:MAG: site-specific integrase [Peptococcaceae bacterium]|jgi:integrase|nr:site-specific integrase [Peptococcaceae bacterium]